MTRSLRTIALFVATALSVTGCGAVNAVLGIHQAPKENAASAALTVDQARSILTRDLAAAQEGQSKTGAASIVTLRTAYSGEGLRAAIAGVKLKRSQPSPADSALLEPPKPLLLAVSRGFGFPRVIVVVQTLTSKGSLPILSLLTSPDAATPYRISVSAEMLPLAKIKPFDALTKGSPLVTDGAGLAAAPVALLNAYAGGMEFPAKAVANPPFAADSFSAQVRAKAASVAKAVATQASFSQVHRVVLSSVYAVRQASGDALVFGVIERMDSFVVKSGQAVNTADEFVRLTGMKRVSKSASITHLEFVVFAVPRSSGQARLVAAREQVVAGSGS